MQNTYQIRNSNCSASAIALTVKDKSVAVTFLNRRRNGLLLYDTENVDIQLAIEASPRFTSGEITRIAGESPVKKLVVGSRKLEVVDKGDDVDSATTDTTTGDGGDIVDDVTTEPIGDSGDIVDGVTSEEAPRPLGTPHEGNLADELPVVPTAFPEVTEWQAAKEILRNEPYNVPFQGLNTPANIAKKAAEVGVVFPNLVK